MDISSELTQKLERKRAYERERKRQQREKLRSNPEAYSKYCKIEKERNERRKTEGKLKSISKMNSMEETRIRSMWRANKARQKQRQQDLENEKKSCKVFNKHRPKKRGKAAKSQRARKMREKQQNQDVIDSDPMSKETQHAENVSPVTECPQNLEKLTPCSSSSEIATSSKTQDSSVTKVPAVVPYMDSDDEDDKPLSKMIGHPNDDQLKALVTKIVKESKLEDVTMKIVIKKVFDNYPNFDLGYRKEYIKSIVRQILSQMEDQSCVSTTVNI